MEGNNPNLIMDGWIPRFLSGWVDYPDGESCDYIGPIRELYFGAKLYWVAHFKLKSKHHYIIYSSTTTYTHHHNQKCRDTINKLSTSLAMFNQER